MPRRAPKHQATRGPAKDPRPPSWQRGYGYRWQRTRRGILRRDPVCVICNAAPSHHVDHVIAKAKGGTDDPENLRGICASCHSRKTVEEDGGFGRPKT